MAHPLPHELTEQITTSEQLEPAAAAVADLATKLTESDPVKNALSGTWLGHRLHPMLTDVVIGAWMSASILDVMAGKKARGAATTLVGVGILASPVTAAAGLSDYADLYGGPRRLALVHGAVNVVGLAMQTRSFRARRQGKHIRGAMWSLAAMAGVGVGGYLGGHLSYVNGIGVDHTAFDEGPDEWTTAMPAGELEDGATSVVTVAGREVLLHRRDGRVMAMANRCTHAGLPMGEGAVQADGCVTCEWHGSRYEPDGTVVRGPAASPQPVFEVREVQGLIEIRAATSR
ncbi:Rieske 2Fe-2S domain-containing protein [Euzebya sp.]|uniref:Rieske 2Fe-2S domain-containing protein n=1 Tax=Euzebya sp. TaxID=1971409 RepID=UPI003518E7A5